MMGLGMDFSGLGLLLMILALGGLIALAVRLVWSIFPRSGQAPGSLASRNPAAREILERRYARGEISQEEQERMRETLSGQAGEIKLRMFCERRERRKR